MQRSLALTPTHCVRCCPFFRRIALRLFGKKGNVRLELTPPPTAMLSSLPCESPCGSSDRKAFVPSFSWFGKCNSSGGKPQRLHSNRLPPACCPFCQADRHRLSGQNGNGLKSCGSHMGLSAICSANRDKSPSEASRSTESALSPKL